MAMEKEALTHKIEDDLAARNRNWDKVTTHLADYATKVIVEKGSNENGTYIRFGDGTQICKFTGNRSVVSSTDNFSWAFPASFFTTEGLYVDQRVKNTEVTPTASGVYIVTVHSVDHTVGVGRGRVVRMSDGATLPTGTILKAYCYAIGRWK